MTNPLIGGIGLGNLEDLFDLTRTFDPENRAPKSEDGKFQLHFLHRTPERRYFAIATKQIVSDLTQWPLIQALFIKSDPKEADLSIEYDVRFSRRDIEDAYYLATTYKKVQDKTRKVLPFRFTGDIPSTIVSKSKEEMLENFFELNFKRFKEYCKYIERGFLKGFDEHKEATEAIYKQIYKTLDDKFGDVENPSTVLNRSQRISTDFFKSYYFKKMTALRAFSWLTLFSAFISPSKAEDAAGLLHKLQRGEDQTQKEKNQEYQDILNLFKEEGILKGYKALNRVTINIGSALYSSLAAGAYLFLDLPKEARYFILADLATRGFNYLRRKAAAGVIGTAYDIITNFSKPRI